MSTRDQSSSRLPALTGPDAPAGSRGLLVALVVVGIGQAGVTIAVTQLLPVLLGTPDTRLRIALTVLGIAAAAAVGAGRMAERVLAERLGQRYAHAVRLRLLTGTLHQSGSSSLGVTVTRASNDLSSVRNWICQGIAPLLSGLPIVLGCAVALVLLAPSLALAAILPIAVLGLALLRLAGPAFRRARALRRQRGRMASRIADTASAAVSINAAGGVGRELKHIDKAGLKVADAAVARSVVTGGMRGAAAGAAMLSMVGVLLVAAWAGQDPAHVASALLVIGVLAGPVTDLGRVGEYRQNFRAAGSALAPALTAADRAEQQEQERRRSAGRRTATGNAGLSTGAVHVSGLHHQHRPLPDLLALPGDRIVVDPRDAEAFAPVSDALVFGRADRADAWVRVAGHSVTKLPAARRRTLVGHSARGLAMEPGTIARAVRYRVPDSESPVGPTLERAGLAETVAALPKGERTQLKAGGAPLDHEQQSLLRLARAFHDDPPLVVLDRVTDELSPAGLVVLRRLLQHYGGVAILVTDRAVEVADNHREWSPTTILSAGPREREEVLV